MDEIRFAVELRDDEQRGPGRLVGTLIRYNERAKDRPELFEPDSLRWPKDGIVLNRQHERRSPILRFVPRVDGTARFGSTKPYPIPKLGGTRRRRFELDCFADCPSNLRPSGSA